jgi:hypothetical protein
MKRNPKVDQFMEKLDNPLKAEMELVREIILSANAKVIEDIKWSAPSFFYKDNICTFNPRAKKFVNLTFHKGALINDKTGLLEGDAKEARVARFDNFDDIAKKKKQLISVINEWVNLMDK